MMKVTVTKNLNVRVGKPSLNAPCYQYLAPGSEIEVEEQFFEGDTFEGTSTWLRDQANNYYWTGGVHVAKVEALPPHEGLIDYGLLLNVNGGLPIGNGAGMNVAILDSGVSIGHPDLVGAVSLSLSFVPGLSPEKDVWGHGTLMAGLIGARSTIRGIRGIAPNCNIINFRVVNDKGNTKMDALKNCLNHIIKNQSTLNIDVISMSISVSDLSFITPELSAISAMGIEIIVAGGNEGLFKSSMIRLLARQASVISVGVIDDPAYCMTGPLPPGLTCFFHNKKLYSTTNYGGYDYVNGDSVYTAIIAGLVVLAKATSIHLTSMLTSRSKFSMNLIMPYR